MTWGKSYLAENVEFGRNSVRDYFFKMFTEKVCRTSYINLESEDFLKKMYETKVHCTNKNYSIHETSRNFHTLGENQVYKINNFLKAKKEEASENLRTLYGKFESKMTLSDVVGTLLDAMCRGTALCYALYMFFSKKVLWQNLHYSSELLIAFLESSKEF